MGTKAHPLGNDELDVHFYAEFLAAVLGDLPSKVFAGEIGPEKQLIPCIGDGFILHFTGGFFCLEMIELVH